MKLYKEVLIESAEQAEALAETASDLVELPQNMKRPGRCYQHRHPGPDRHGRTAMRNSTHPIEGTKFHTDPVTAFATRTEREGDCLVWTGSTDDDGYGRLSVNGRWTRAHRYAWEQVYGSIPEHGQIDHQCWNRACVEITHLRLATNAENVRNGSGARPTNRSTGARNVYPKGKKFRVQIVKDGKSYRFGVHETIEAAAAVAEVKRREMFGEFAGRG